MEKVVTAREFNLMCQKRGFAHLKKGFYRCIGDGVYQTIYTGDTCFIDTSSPWYSSTHRRSNYIGIGLYSIYSVLPEFWFDPKYPKGEIDPKNIIGKRDLFFQGIQEHYEIMKSIGFDFLDEINSQKKLIEAVDQICIARLSEGLKKSRVMCIPYLICGEKSKAYNIIQSWLEDPDMIKWRTTTWEGDPKAEDKKIVYQEYLELKEAVFSEEKLLALIRRNYRKNMNLANHYGIPIRNTFSSLVSDLH